MLQTLILELILTVSDVYLPKDERKILSSIKPEEVN